MRSLKLWSLVLGLALLHALIAANLPLVEDEAYYRMWASVPSAGYYDHPPVVAWLIAAGEFLFGQTPFGVRAASVLISALVVLLSYRIGFLFGRDAKIGFRAALFSAAMMPIAAFGFAATPDAASVLFWTAAVWALAEAITAKAPVWWLAVGVFAGLGVLSKFTNLFFGLSLVLWLLFSREGRAWLGRWQVWAGAALGILVLVPFALWNLNHGWVGLERQFGRLGQDTAFSSARIGGFWLSFIFLVTPLTFLLALRGMADRRTPKVLLWLVLPIILYLGYHAIRAPAGGQWLVPIYPSLAVIAAIGAPAGRLRNWAAPVGFALSLLILAAGFWPGRVIIPGNNPFTEGRGWPAVKTEIRARMKETGAVWIATDAYGLTAQLWHYMGAKVPVWSMTDPQRYLFRPPFPPSLCNATGLFVSRTAFPGAVPYFANSRPLPDILRRQGGKLLMRYYVAVVRAPNAGAAPGCAR